MEVNAEGHTTIDLRNLPAGTYLLKMTSEGSVRTKCFMKK